MLENIVAVVLAIVVAICLLCFTVAVFGGPLLLAYQVVTMGQLFATIGISIGVGALACMVVYFLGY